MTINLPDDLERFIRAEVCTGHFATADAAIAEAVRLLQSQLRPGARATPGAAPTDAGTAPDPVLGSMRDAAGEMDEVVADAMRHREQQSWRLSPP